MPLTRRRPALGRTAWLLDGPGAPWVAAALDAVALVAALALGATWTGAALTGPALAALATFPVLALLALTTARGRARRLDVDVLDDVWPLVGPVSIAAMLTAALTQQVAAPEIDPATMPVAWAVGVALVGGAHMGMRTARRVARTHGLSERPTVIVGAGRVGARVARRLAESPEYGLRPVGFLDASPPPSEVVGGRPVPVLGGPDDLAEVIRRTRARHVVLAFSAEPDHLLLPLVRSCEELGVEVSLVPRLFESTNDRMTYEPIGGLPLLGLRVTDPRSWRFTAKHAGDRVGSALLLIAFAPVLLGVALAIRLSSPGPVLFRQTRVGRDGQVFDLLKFRTMRGEPDGRFGGRLAPGSAPGGVEGVDRRTPIGRLLRRTSLDELPQLANVLRGQMSLVGPRPERPEFVALFSEGLDRYADRHRVRSGITGWAQVHGLRGQTSLVDRLELDNYYIEHWSFALDVKILLRTLLAAFRVPE